LRKLMHFDRPVGAPLVVHHNANMKSTQWLTARSPNPKLPSRG
jgi:hypothetical protein